MKIIVLKNKIAKFASQGDAHVRTDSQIKFLYYLVMQKSELHDEYLKPLSQKLVSENKEVILLSDFNIDHTFP